MENKKGGNIILKCILTILLFALSTPLWSATLKLAFVGDILVARSVGKKIIANGMDYPFRDVSPILKSADIVFGNFECTLYGNQITGTSKQLVFRAPIRFAQAVSSSGIDIVSLANNHMLDAGRDGVISTIRSLESIGIKTVGAGETSNEAYACRVIESRGIKVGFLAFTDIANTGLSNAKAMANRSGVASAADLPKVTNAISRARRQCDLMVVSFHFGVEYQTTPNARQKMLVSLALKSGADIIIGHHPHVLQPIVQIAGRTAAYSLGNFVFDNHKPSRARTEILIINYDTKTGRQSVQQIPCYIRNCQPQIIR